MSTQGKTFRNTRATRTYLPEADDRDDVIDFAAFMRELDAYRRVNSGKAALVNPMGEPRSIPEGIYRILEQVADSLASGKAVTVAPYGMMLTTQQAADFLGVSRPTLVTLLERGDIAFERPGRHRRVALRDLVDYKESFGAAREAALDDLARTTVDSPVQAADPASIERKNQAR